MRLLLPLSLAALLIAAGCSKDKDVEPPAKLVEFPADAAGQEAVGRGRRRRQEAGQAAPGAGSGDRQRPGIRRHRQGRGARGVARNRPARLGQEAQSCRCRRDPRRGFGMVVVGTQQGRGDRARRRDRARAVAHAGQFRAAVRARDQRERRRHALGRRPAARLRRAHRQGAVVGRTAGAAPEPARHGDSHRSPRRWRSAASTTAR